MIIPSMVDCPGCETTFEVAWMFPARVETAQDITEDDIESQTIVCPSCHKAFVAQYEGWSSHDDAG